jgi:protein TonB
MFEDSTFESTGRIRTRSRNWMFATFAINGSVLLALILIPLIHPEALPRQLVAYLMELPAPLAEQPKPQQAAHIVPFHSELDNGQIVAPPRIPIGIVVPGKPEAAPVGEIPGWEAASALPNGTESIFHGRPAPAVHPDLRGPVHVPSSIVEGLLILKVVPLYPAIARTIRLQGTVVLQATISKTGTIENLHVASGPGPLQQAALDAVKSWRYRPYLLNGEPVGVETTINVVFRLGQ